MSDFNVGDTVQCAKTSELDFPGVPGETYVVADVRSVCGKSGLTLQRYEDQPGCNQDRFRLFCPHNTDQDPALAYLKSRLQFCDQDTRSVLSAMLREVYGLTTRVTTFPQPPRPPAPAPLIEFVPIVA